MVVEAAHRKSCPVGICGQAPSDYPEFAQFLADIGIDSISLNPDSLAEVTRRLAAEKDPEPGEESATAAADAAGG
jgi:pyruvate,water dikinase